MRRLLPIILLLLASPSHADDMESLYQSSGLEQHRSHFRLLLLVARQKYEDQLPPALYARLKENSEQRFASGAMDSRAIAALRGSLQDPRAAQAFYASEVGEQIVAAETDASQPLTLAGHQGQLPQMQVSAQRRQLVAALAEAVPASAAGAEVGLALGSLAADSLNQMLAGLLGGDQAQSLVIAQRQNLIREIDADILNTLLYIYQDLSDAQLQTYLDFARSAPGQEWFRAALIAVRAGLAVGLSGNRL